MRIKPTNPWPLLPDEITDFKTLLMFLRKLRQTWGDRDKKIALAINAGDIEIATSEPSDAPDYGEPQQKLFKSGATWRLYAYTGSADGWQYWDADS